MLYCLLDVYVDLLFFSIADHTHQRQGKQLIIE